MLKSPDFHATYDPIVTKSKGMLKSPDFHANQSSLIVSVVNFTFIVNDSASLHRLISGIFSENMNFKSLSSFFFQFRIWHLKWGIHTMDHQWSHCERSLGKTPRGLYSLWGVSSLNSCKGPSGLLSRAFYLIDGSKQLKMLIVFSCGCIYTWCNLYAPKGSTIPTERR